MLHRVSKAAALVCIPLLWACSEIPHEDRPAVLNAVFDPSTSDVPSPNDLAMVDGVVAIQPVDGAPEADNELKASLNGRDGFSSGSVAQVKFTGALSAATLSSDSVVVIDLGNKIDHAPPRTFEDAVFEYDDCNHSVNVSSQSGFEAGHTYLLAVRGGEKADPNEPDTYRVKGVDGEPVYAAPAFYFLKAGKDLREHPDAFPGTPTEKAASAAALEQVREKYEPLIQLLETFGLKRQDLAVLWTFTVQTGGEALFDPARQNVPMPNDLLRDPVTGRVTLPISPDEPAPQQELKHGLNQLDGFSTSGALTLEFTRPLKFEDWVAQKRVRIFRADTLEEKTDFTVNVWPDGVRMSIEPQSPLLPNTQYVVVVSGLQDTAANPVTGMPLSQVLKLSHPLVEDAQSTVSSLCLETAQRLEPLRQQIAPVLDAIAQDTPREEISAVWTFKTLDILSRVQALYETPYKQNLPLSVTIESNDSPLGAALPFFHVERVITGKMITYDYLDPATTAFRENGQGVQRPIDFVLTIPSGYKKGSKVPVVVFGHGLLTERRLGYFVADKLADSGFAMMAIDFPLHGERSVCSQDLDCENGATCAADRTCRKGGQKADFRRATKISLGGASFDFSPWGQGTPVSTGMKYVDLEHLIAARDHLRQTLVDVSAQIRLIRQMNWLEATGGWQLDGDNIQYAGISLGGITGANMSAVDPNLKRMLLNVGGAGVVELLEDSKTLGTVMRLGLKSNGINPERGDPGYEQFRNAGHWVVDEVDPANLIPYGNFSPRTYVDAETGETKTMAKKPIRLQMAYDPTPGIEDDEVVPNTSTMRLLRLSHLDPKTQFRKFEPATHGFLADCFTPIDIASCIAGQQDMVDFLEGKK